MQHWSSCLLLIVALITTHDTTCAMENVTISSGETATLLCNKTSLASNMRWLKLDTNGKLSEETYTEGESINPYLPIRNRLRLSTQNAVYDLHIFNAESSDSGLYRCEDSSKRIIIFKDIRFLVSSDQMVPQMTTVPTNNNGTNFPNTSNFDYGNNEFSSRFTVGSLYLVSAVVGFCCILIASAIILNPCRRLHKVHTSLMQQNGQEASSIIEYVGGGSTIIGAVDLPISVICGVVTEMAERNSSGYIKMYEPLVNNWAEYTHSYCCTNVVNADTGEAQHVYDECGTCIKELVNVYQPLTRNWKESSHTYV